MTLISMTIQPYNMGITKKEVIMQKKLLNTIKMNNAQLSRIKSENGNSTVITINLVTTAVDSNTKAAKDTPTSNYSIDCISFSFGITIVNSSNKVEYIPELPLNPYELLSQLFSVRKHKDHILGAMLWHFVLNSGVLDDDPEAIHLKITPNNDLAMHMATDAIFLLTAKEESNYQTTLRFPGRQVKSAIVSSLHADSSTGHITINFCDPQNLKATVAHALTEEQTTIDSVEKYVAEHLQGFHFLVFWSEDDLDADYPTLDEFYTIVHAWTPEDAIQQYIRENEHPLMGNYYFFSFVGDFCDFVLSDEFLFQRDNLTAAEQLIIQAYDEKYHGIDYGFNSEEIRDYISETVSREELFNLIGEQKFKEFWFQYEYRHLHAVLSQDENKIYEYLFQ